MDELINLIEKGSEEEIDRIIEKLRTRVVIPFCFRMEDLEIILSDLHDDPRGIIDTQLHSLTLRYHKLRKGFSDEKLFLNDIYKYLIEHTEEINVNNHWSQFVENLLCFLEDFDISNRNEKIEKLLFS